MRAWRRHPRQARAPGAAFLPILGALSLAAAGTAGAATPASPASPAVTHHSPARTVAPRQRATLGTPLRYEHPQAGPHRAASSSGPATGIVPPGNPPRNVWPPNPDFVNSCTYDAGVDNSTACLSAAEQATNSARRTESVGPMSFSVAALQRLTVPEQLFVITDMERVARGLPPMAAMTSQLDGYAQQGANAGGDPNPGNFAPAGGGYVEAWGSNWAGGTSDALVSNYYFMYDDGYPSGNIDCNSPSASGCWGHRDNILGTYLYANSCGGPSELIMGAAVSTSPAQNPAPSFAELLAGVCGTPSGVVYTWAQAEMSLHLVVGLSSTSDGGGYVIADTAGDVSHFGDAPVLGDLSGRSLSAAVVGVAVDPATGGYWLVASDGGVFGFGAHYYGGEGGTRLTRPVVGMAATADGKGYWIVASDGGVFTFGDAHYRGSEGGKHLNSPIVGIAADPATGGYWLVASDGGIFAFSAPYLGSEGGTHLNAPTVGMEVSGNGTGYRFVASDGGIFDFRARFYGSEGGTHLNSPITGMAEDPVTGGYWLVAADGGVFSFHAPYHGSAA